MLVNLLLYTTIQHGNPTPSRDDINITLRLQDLSELFDIELLDHIVIGANNDFASCMRRNI